MPGKEYEHINVATLVTMRTNSVMRGIAEAVDYAGSLAGKMVYFEHDGRRIEVKPGQAVEELYRLWNQAGGL